MCLHILPGDGLVQVEYVLTRTMLKLHLFNRHKLIRRDSNKKFDDLRELVVLSMQVYAKAADPVDLVESNRQVLGQRFKIAAEPDKRWVPQKDVGSAAFVVVL